MAQNDCNDTSKPLHPLFAKSVKNISIYFSLFDQSPSGYSLWEPLLSFFVCQISFLLYHGKFLWKNWVEPTARPNPPGLRDLVWRAWQISWRSRMTFLDGLDTAANEGDPPSPTPSVTVTFSYTYRRLDTRSSSSLSTNNYSKPTCIACPLRSFFRPHGIDRRVCYRSHRRTFASPSPSTSMAAFVNTSTLLLKFSFYSNSHLA